MRERGEVSGWRIHERKARVVYNLIVTLYVLFVIGIVGAQIWVTVHFMRKFW